MTLVGSAPLYLTGAGQADNRSIEFELTGNKNGYTLLTAITDSGEAYDRMSDFYGYSACSDTIPSTPSAPSPSWLQYGVIQVYFSKPFNADGIDCDHSTNGSSWSVFYYGYTGSSPLSSSNSCSYTYYRIRAYNCAGASSWSNGTNAGNCP